MLRQRRNPADSGADHSVMRELNRSLVLDQIKQTSPVSRADLAKVTALAKPTVSAIVDALLSEDLVREIGTGSTGREGGRPPILIEFNARSQFVVGVHLGVRRTTAVIADARGEEITRVQRPTVHGPAESAVRRIAEMIEETVAAAGVSRKRLVAVGVCVPGLVDLTSGVVMLAPNLGWRDVGMRQMLSDLIEVPVFIHNSAQASAVAESILGAGSGARDLVFLYAGTGIGAGVLSEGRLFHGGAGIAGEIGHCRVPGATARCNCGKIGCLETVASGPAIAKAAGSKTAAGPDPTAEQVALAAAAGDEKAAAVVANAGEALGIAASWLINLFNPEVLVVGGGLVGAGDLLVEPLRKAALEMSLPQAADRVSIRTSSLGQDAEVAGAVLVALQYSETYYRVIFQS